MNWDQWDVARLGRLLGALIIVGGILVSAWAALDHPEGYPRNESAQLFFRSALSYAASGGLVLVGAEIAVRLGWGGRDADEAFEEPDEPPEAATPTV